MVTNYYNASNNFRAPIRREPKPFRECVKDEISEKEEVCLRESEKEGLLFSKGPFSSLDTDAILILALGLILLSSGCDDKLLLVALLSLILF